MTADSICPIHTQFTVQRSTHTDTHGHLGLQSRKVDCAVEVVSWWFVRWRLASSTLVHYKHKLERRDDSERERKSSQQLGVCWSLLLRLFQTFSARSLACCLELLLLCSLTFSSIRVSLTLLSLSVSLVMRSEHFSHSFECTRYFASLSISRSQSKHTATHSNAVEFYPYTLALNTIAYTLLRSIPPSTQLLYSPHTIPHSVRKVMRTLKQQ